MIKINNILLLLATCLSLQAAPNIKQLLQEIQEDHPEFLKGRLKNKKRQTVEQKRAFNDCKAIECPSAYARRYKPIKCKAQCRPAVNLIKQCHFKGKGRNGIILDKPGVYRLSEDIIFSPTQEGTTAITIAHSDAILDLDVFTLSQGNDVKYVYGIAICRDASHVKITGELGRAQVRDFTSVGIRVFGRTDSIILENVIVTQSEPHLLVDADIPEDCTQMSCANVRAGIAIGEGDTEFVYMKGTDANNLVTNLTITHVTCSKSTIGCQLIYTQEFTIDQSNFIENTFKGLLLGTSWVIPVYIDGVIQDYPARDFCINGCVINCHFDRNNMPLINNINPLDGNGNSLNWSILAEAYVNNECTNITVENSTFNDNVSDALILVVDHDGSFNSIWKNCEAHRNSGLFVDGFHFSGSLPQVYGPCAFGVDYLYQNDVNVEMNNCVSMNNIAVLNGRAFFLSGIQGALIKDCFATGNTGFRTGIGFSVVGLLAPGILNQGVVLDNCVAENNSLLGFLVLGDCYDIVIRNCIANNNLSLANPGGPVREVSGISVSSLFAGGQMTETPKRITIEGCTVSHNGIDIITTFIAGGITVSGIADAVLIQNNTIANNSGDGVYIDAPVTNAVVKNNEADTNTKIGFNVLATAPVLVAKNIAYNNLVANYFGVPAGTIVSGDTDNLPVTTNLQNASIVPAP